jgi:hypothetical protein
MSSRIHSSFAHISGSNQVSTVCAGKYYTSTNLHIVKCFKSTVDGRISLGLTVLVTILDLLSDIMGTLHMILRTWQLITNIASVVSLPIIVLWNSLLSRSTKFGLAIFLCLSIFMAICAIIRLAGFHYKGLEDDTWEFFWQHIEGAVSVMMASITAFRTLFIKQTTNNPENIEPPNNNTPAETSFHRLFRRFQTLARAQPDEIPASMQNGPVLKLPKLPSPVFTGVRSFIRGNNRTRTETDASAATSVTIDSVIDGDEVDYHAALKTQMRAAPANLHMV